MEVKRLEVGHFRGIERLTWDLGGAFIGLVGPGDSTKTTILEALNLVLTPRRNVSFEDTDFFNADTTRPIRIQATVSNVPAELLGLERFGELVRGWSDGGLRDEPAAGDEPVLTISLQVDAMLEPDWSVVCDRSPAGKRISAYDRAKLGVTRIGAYVDWQLSWAQGSALTRMMAEKGDGHQALAEARRKAKTAFQADSVPLLADSADAATKAGKTVGVQARNADAFSPNLDLREFSLGMGVLALHDGAIPLRQAGLGSSRLLTTVLQRQASLASGLALIDEVEHALEPHRLRRLLQVLRASPGQRGGGVAEGGVAEAQASAPQQVVFTTHSAVAISELQPRDLRVVRSSGGLTEVRLVPAGMRSLLRANPEAFLGRKVIVCEGKTELGLCRALDRWWASPARAFAYSGIVLADGAGNTKGPAAAIGFAGLGYSTLYFGDSDAPPEPGPASVEAAGSAVILWPGDMSTEERIASDLPWPGFVKMVRLAREERGGDHVRSKLASALGRSPADIPKDPEEWVPALGDDAAVRAGFAHAAKSKNAEWFKRVDLAEALGEIVTNHWAEVATKPLGESIARLESWAYGNGA